MASPTYAHLEGNPETHDERLRDDQAPQRKQEQEREAHRRNVEAAYRMMHVFNQNGHIFRKYGIAYCLDEEEPPFAPAISMFRRRKGRNPDVIFIPVVVDGGHKTFSLRSLSKRKRREQFGFFGNLTKFYEEHHIQLSDDPEEAAREITRRLSAKELKFESLWQFDRTMAHCVRRYFVRRDMRRAFVCLTAVVAMALVLSFQGNWR